MEGAAGLRPGDHVAGDFEIVRLLGEGGFGAVYEARQLSTQAPRALKVMRPELVKDDRLRTRFDQEARVSAGIPSDHVVGVIASGVDARGYPWLAMELLEGQPLSAALPPGGFDPATALEILSQLCHGLGAAHSVSVVHRDLKPENVFLAKARRAGVPFTVKILDFGIAKVLAEAASTRTASLGTPLWAAPEQMEPNARVGPTTDVWALGLVGFWLLTGRYFWAAANADDVSVQAVLKESLMDPIPPPIARVRQLGLSVELPPRFGEWFARCVDRDPAARFPDANAAGEALTAAFAGGGGSLTAMETRQVSHAVPPTQTSFVDRRAAPGQVPFARQPGEHPTGLSPAQHMQLPAPPPRRSNPGLWIGLLVLVAAGVAAGMFALVPSWSSPSSRGSGDSAEEDEEERDEETSGRTGKGKSKQKDDDPDEDPAQAATSGERGRVAVTCSPECFQVLINGVDRGASPVDVELEVGDHSVEARSSAGLFPPRRVPVQAGQTTRVILKSGGGSSVKTAAPLATPAPTPTPVPTPTPKPPPAPPPPSTAGNCGCPPSDLMCAMTCSSSGKKN